MAVAWHCTSETEMRHKECPHEVLKEMDGLVSYPYYETRGRPVLLIWHNGLSLSARRHRSLGSDTTSGGFNGIPELTGHRADPTCICVPSKGRPMMLAGESCTCNNWQ